MWVVSCRAVALFLSRLADVPLFLNTGADLVKPGGLTLVATINRTLKALATAKIAAEYVLRWLPRGTHRWSEFRKPGEIEALLEQGGLGVRQRSGVSVNPLTHAFSLTRRMSVNYMVMASREHARSRSKSWSRVLAMSKAEARPQQQTES